MRNPIEYFEMRKLLSIILILLVVVFTACIGNTKPQDKGGKGVELVDSTDQAIFNSIKEIVQRQSLDSLSIDLRIIEIAKMFLQTPYVGGTLEGNGPEKLRVNFRELDCTTYLENVVVLSVIAGKRDFKESDFLKELEKLRYRKGKLTDYTSRLHYFTDWIFENESKGIVKNITAEIGGVKYDKNIDFISTHVESYPALKADSSFVKIIRDNEKAINNREMYFIPEEDISKLENKIQNGDLIAITTKIKGLEISHVGIALHVNDRLHLMHASSHAKKVVISEIPLADMLMKNKLQSGIMLVRVQ